MSFLARVVVTPKPVVNDPQGLTVRQGLVALGFEEIERVRVGKHIEITLEAPDQEVARQRVEAMCDKLLANHVIEDYRFTIDSPSPPPALRATSPARGEG